MKIIAVLLGTALAVFPSVSYLADLRYRLDPSLEHSVCRNLVCSDKLLLESAERFANGGKEEKAIAVANLQEALRRNVASAYRWIDLGEAFVATGRNEEARHAYMQAAELAPLSPPILWRVALFHTQVNDRQGSLEYLGKMLDLVPQYRELVFGMYLSNEGGVLNTLEHGIPPHSRLAQDYFRYLVGHARREDVRKAWDWLRAHSLADAKVAGDYVDLLAKQGEYNLAHQTWVDIAGGGDDAYLKPNRVFNGSFELEPAQTGLDWRLPGTQNVLIRRDSAVAHSGKSSLLVEFDGKKNVDFNNVAQNLIVNPGRYRFKAWVRTSELTTDQGIGLRVADTPGRLKLKTKQLTGTNEWTPLELDFTLSGPTRLLRIEVVREASWKFVNKISGRAWIDSVSLVRVD